MRYKYRYSPRFSRRINPFRLGFANDFVQTHFNLPFECIFITEAQKYLNSRMSMYFPDWQSRWYEQHGHNDLDIWLDTQRPMLIDVNIRELSQFIEIMSLEFSYNGYGRIARFNYFCTFTYSDEKHTEESFKKALQTCLRNLCYRKEWKYMGVWERSPEKQRLHFHGLFYIPENAMVGELFEKTDYDLRNHRMRTTVQNTFFNKKYGRSDFEEILPIENNLERELSYLMKYIEKSGEKIVYSKGLFQYFISDIMDEDIVSTIGQEEKKLLLFDDFNCWDEGLYMGKVSSEVIAQMRKCN